MTEASDTLRRARRPGRADRTSARARHEPGRRIRAVRKTDVSNEGTARSAAWRLPEAGIVKGLASPLTRTPAAERLKLPDAWRAEPAQSPSAQQINRPAGGTRSAPVRAANLSPQRTEPCAAGKKNGAEAPLILFSSPATGWASDCASPATPPRAPAALRSATSLV